MTNEERAAAYLMGEFSVIKPGALHGLTQAFDTHAAEAKAEQQQDCADAVSEYLAGTEYEDGTVRVCLNAGESDDKKSPHDEG